MKIQKLTMTLRLLVFGLLVLRIDGQLEQCFVDTESPYVYFSSKTSYHASRKSQINIPEGCTPTYLWAFIRHGTRYPDREFIKSMKSLNDLRNEIITNHKEGRGKLCIKDLENLEKWGTNLTTDISNDLTSQGRQDHMLLARRLKQKFPNLLAPSLKDSFVFQSSATRKTKESAIVFSNELLNTNYKETDGNNITENELLLRAIHHCPRYTAEMENNPSIYEQAKLFESSQLMQKVISDISVRLGFREPLTIGLVELMYGICAYETAWYINSRPAFCAAFVPDDLKVLEYLDDVKRYYDKGYGTPFAAKLGCVIVQDMMTSLLNAVRNTDVNPKATFYFSHSEMLQPTTTKLGLNRDDEPLKHDNYERMKNDRKWRLAFFDSFAANIIAVAYKCPGPLGIQNKAIIYQNERQVEIPQCTQNPCVLEDLLQNFGDVFNETHCNLKFCQYDPVKKSNGNLIFLNLYIVLVSIFVSLGLNVV